MNFKGQESFVQQPRGSDEKTVEIFHSESLPNWNSSERTNISLSRAKIVVTGAFPMDENAYSRGEFVETIRDPRDPGRLAFLSWNNGSPIIVHEIERDGKIYVPPEKNSGLLAKLTLSDGVRPDGGVQQLAADLGLPFSRFFETDPDGLQIAVSIALSTWFPDCFEAVPYLWVVGPIGSAKTAFLKLLACLCRRAVLVGDIRAAALYQLVHGTDITLIIDELEFDDSRSASDVLRLLRTGNTRDVDVIRNGQRFSTFCFKAMASRQPPTDAALASRALFISMRPTSKSLEVLDEVARQQVIQELQPRLLAFRFENLSRVRQDQHLPLEVLDLTPRMKQIARVLMAPLQGDADRQSRLISILRDRDRDGRVARTLEPEWLVAEALFRICHEQVPRGGRVCDILVGGVADEVNEFLEDRGEGFELSARKTGAVLSALRIKTKRLGNLGRGMVVDLSFLRKIHQLARDLGLDRTILTSIPAIEHGYGGARCLLCEEFGLTAGLRCLAVDRPRPRGIVSKYRVHEKRRPLFDEPDEVNLEHDCNTEDQVGREKA